MLIDLSWILIMYLRVVLFWPHVLISLKEVWTNMLVVF